MAATTSLIGAGANARSLLASVEQARPECVVFPRSTEDVTAIVELANRYETPIVARGAGTGLSGGALARKGGILLGFSRMNRILEIDGENQEVQGLQRLVERCSTK